MANPAGLNQRVRPGLSTAGLPTTSARLLGHPVIVMSRAITRAQGQHRQKSSRNPNWISRGVFDVDVMRPTCEGTLILLAGGLNVGWFSTLKDSARNCRRMRSVIGVFL